MACLLECVCPSVIGFNISIDSPAFLTNPGNMVRIVEAQNTHLNLCCHQCNNYPKHFKIDEVVRTCQLHGRYYLTYKVKNWVTSAVF